MGNLDHEARKFTASTKFTRLTRRYYDPINKRLVCFGEKASKVYWSKVWQKVGIQKEILSHRRDYLVCPETKKYLLPGASILEAGCGIGRNIYLLNNLGYRAIGIDSASKTVKTVNNLFPDLPIEVGDVRRTRFKDNSFDGYWSIGVIEHFIGGYDPVVREMKRVLKPGGYAFVTFPYLSPIRRLKIKLGLYPTLRKLAKIDFYQYIYDTSQVSGVFERSGFRLVATRPFDGYKGLKEETGFAVEHGKLVLSILAIPFFAHSVLLVLKKNE